LYVNTKQRDPSYSQINLNTEGIRTESKEPGSFPL
jgi:hypothetical protein